MFVGGSKSKLRLVMGDGNNEGASLPTPAVQANQNGEQQEYTPGQDTDAGIFGLPTTAVIIGAAVIVAIILIMATGKKGDNK